MAVPAQLYLRQPSGEPIGPLPAAALEVLWDARVVYEATPVSADGNGFRPLEQWPELLDHLRRIKEELLHGGNPWRDGIDFEIHSTPVTDQRLLAVLLRAGIEKRSGTLSLSWPEGTTQVSYKDGKIVAVQTDRIDLTLADHLIRKQMATPLQIQQAEERAPQFGGDLGGALIASGQVPPHLYFEQLVAWSKDVLVAALTEEPEQVVFDPGAQATSAAPLGLDRLGVVIELVRAAFSRPTLQERLLPKRTRALIRSHVEGVTHEELKLQAREQRVLHAIDGTKSLDVLLETLGGSDEATLSVLRAVYFAEQVGLAVWGDDPLHKQEHAEAELLEKMLERFSKQNHFEILGVSERSSDEEVRTKYTDLAKKYHPDTLRAEALLELQEIRRRVFARIGEAFAAVETESQRYKYADDLSHGRIGNTDEAKKVQDTLRAEMLFKKAEILTKVKKYDEALSHLTEAIQLNDGDQEFKVHRAYVTYLRAAKQGKGEEAAQIAIKTIQGVLKTDANIASGYLFLGYLNKAVNKPEVAVRYFEKVLEYDDHHADAIREVRVANLRKEKAKKGKWI